MGRPLMARGPCLTIKCDARKAVPDAGIWEAGAAGDFRRPVAALPHPRAAGAARNGRGVATPAV